MRVAFRPLSESEMLQMRPVVNGPWRAGLDCREDEANMQRVRWPAGGVAWRDRLDVYLTARRPTLSSGRSWQQTWDMRRDSEV